MSKITVSNVRFNEREVGPVTFHRLSHTGNPTLDPQAVVCYQEDTRRDLIIVTRTGQRFQAHAFNSRYSPDPVLLASGSSPQKVFARAVRKAWA